MLVTAGSVKEGAEGKYSAADSAARENVQSAIHARNGTGWASRDP